MKSHDGPPPKLLPGGGEVNGDNPRDALLDLRPEDEDSGKKSLMAAMPSAHPPPGADWSYGMESG
jgi:hypothetical protein